MHLKQDKDVTVNQQFDSH